MSEPHPLSLEHALLGLLRHQPMHGYEILQQFTPPAELGLVWRIKQSHLYALLAKLEDLGYIAGTLTPQGAKPPRRVLRLTAAGEATVVAWLAAPVAHGRDFRQEFLAKLYFALQDGAKAARQLIVAQRGACAQWQQRHEARLVAAADAPFPHLVYAYRLGQTGAILAFLDQCDAMVSSSLPII